MLVVFSPSATPDNIEEIKSDLSALGYGVHSITGTERTVVGATGGHQTDEETIADGLRTLPYIADVFMVDKPYRLAAREHHPEPTIIDVRGVKIGGDSPVVIMAGPCTVESRDQLLSTAKAVKELGATILRGGAYKPSTSPYGFPGMGEDGLKLLAEARELNRFADYYRSHGSAQCRTRVQVRRYFADWDAQYAKLRFAPRGRHGQNAPFV